MKKSLKQQLKDYLRNKLVFVSKGELEQWGMNKGYLGDNVSRRLRELVNEGFIEKRAKGRSLEYRWVDKLDMGMSEAFNKMIQNSKQKRLI